jgi:hypothetical protein
MVPNIILVENPECVHCTSSVEEEKCNNQNMRKVQRKDMGQRDKSRNNNESFIIFKKGMRKKKKKKKKKKNIR